VSELALSAVATGRLETALWLIALLETAGGNTPGPTS
jgi:hypothetical protein